jgi:hypothetical protein
VLVRRGRQDTLVDVPARPAGRELGDEPEGASSDDLDPVDLDDHPLDDGLLDDGLLEDDDADEQGPAVDDEEEVLADEPLARTLVFLLLGFVVMVAGLASVIAA